MQECSLSLILFNVVPKNKKCEKEIKVITNLKGNKTVVIDR